METKQKERIRRLMELLKKTDRIHLKEAARMLEVSVMTIRRISVRMTSRYRLRCSVVTL